ncbi:glycosyltransferase family 4 protein [Candidatus Omnitrophota bacterium]
MRVLVIGSLYSSLVDSLLNREWRPKGMPSFVKLVEQFERESIAYDVLLVAQRTDADKGIPREVVFDGMHGRFYVYPYPQITTLISKIKQLYPIAVCIRDLRVILFVIKLCVRKKYDVFHCDRENIMVGAFLAFFLRKKVFLRLHGVVTLCEQFKTIKTRLYNIIRYVSFKAPFKYVLCSMDGTPTKKFLSAFINKKVPYEVKLNGVDTKSFRNDRGAKIRESYGIDADMPVILFVGNLEKKKGVDIFISSLTLLAAHTKDFRAFIVGYGSLEREMKDLAESVGLLDNIYFIGGVAHNDMYGFYQASDIYVSLNQHGNLSNTTLEAIKAGNCIVTFGYCSETMRDKDTEEMLKDNAVFISRVDSEHDLAHVLGDLVRDRSTITRLKASITKNNAPNLWTWDQRMRYEVELMEKVS